MKERGEKTELGEREAEIVKLVGGSVAVRETVTPKVHSQSIENSGESKRVGQRGRMVSSVNTDVLGQRRRERNRRAGHPREIHNITV